MQEPVPAEKGSKAVVSDSEGEEQLRSVVKVRKPPSSQPVKRYVSSFPTLY